MIVMSVQATPEDVDNVARKLKSYGREFIIQTTSQRTTIKLITMMSLAESVELSKMRSVIAAWPSTTSLKLIHLDNTGMFPKIVNRFSNINILLKLPVFIAGPCAVESKEQITRIAREVKIAGANALRGGIFKPRTSVHTFQGLGANKDTLIPALEWLKEAGDTNGLPIVSEVLSELHIPVMADYVDIFQIGTRNMFNQSLLQAIASTGKPILLKRNFGASAEELLNAAEYIASKNNFQIILCERGVLPTGKGDNYVRYTLDVGSIPVLRSKTFLPLIVDPSHAAGKRDLVEPFSYAAMAAGADGLIIECHYDPDNALIDGPQQVKPGVLERIIRKSLMIREDLHV